MTDTPELNVWREACRCYEDGAARDLTLPMCDMVIAGDQAAASVIRTYIDERDAEAYQRGKLEGARLAIEAAARVGFRRAVDGGTARDVFDTVTALSPAKIVGEG